MFDILAGLLSYLGVDIENSDSKKDWLIFSLAFGVLIFLAICVDEFFINADKKFILFAVFGSLGMSVIFYICFWIAYVLRKYRQDK